MNRSKKIFIGVLLLFFMIVICFAIHFMSLTSSPWTKKKVQEIINLAKRDSEKMIVEKTQKFHQMMEDRRKNAEQKINLMKENALKDIKNISIKISIEAVESLINNSIDKKKLEKFYSKSLEQAKTVLKNTRV